MEEERNGGKRRRKNRGEVIFFQRGWKRNAEKSFLRVKKGKEVKVIERGATSGLLVRCLNLTKNKGQSLRCGVSSIRFATGSKFRSQSM